MRSNNRISRSSRTGAIVAVVSTEVPIDSGRLTEWEYDDNVIGFEDKLFEKG